MFYSLAVFATTVKNTVQRRSHTLVEFFILHLYLTSTEGHLIRILPRYLAEESKNVKEV